MRISDFNPWWKTAAVPGDLVGKPRELLTDLFSHLGFRQILLLYGIRRAGKTTLMYQIVHYLLDSEKVSPHHLLFVSFDLRDHTLDDVIDYFRIEILRKDIRSFEKVWLFLDEIQKLPNWENEVKILYDLYPNLKIVLSGSAALPILKGTKESLAGRFFGFHVKPLSFDEFITFREAGVDRSLENLYETEIRTLFQDYLITGGFIEALDFGGTVLRQYFRESLLERILYRDIPECFRIGRPELLFRLMAIICQQPGMYTDYKSLGNDLKMDQRTVSNYVTCLRHSLIVTKIYNYSRNRLTSEKKLKRIYPANTAFSAALSPDSTGIDWLLESFYVDLFKAEFFYRTPTKDEVDIILDDGNTPFPVEIKIREKIRPADLNPMIRFMERFDCDCGMMISKNLTSVETRGERNIQILPYWKYWSILDAVGRVFPGGSAD